MKRRCQCLGRTDLYGHNSGCPMNPLSPASLTRTLASAIPVGILLGFVLLHLGLG